MRSSFSTILLLYHVLSIWDFLILTCTIYILAPSISEYAFKSCNLENIEIPSSVTSIGGNAFYECRDLSSIEIPSSVTDIGEYAFAFCSSLKSMEIPSSVTSIGDRVFYGCSSLESIEIPSSVTSIGEQVFGDCWSLSKINVEKNNTNYSSVDGVLFNKNQTTLICYPVGKKEITYIIPVGVISWSYVKI